MPDAVRSLLADAGEHPPSAQLWTRLLVALGLPPASAEQIPVRLGTVVRRGPLDESAVREQLDVWAAGQRLRGDTGDADVLTAAAAAIGEPQTSAPQRSEPAHTDLPHGNGDAHAVVPSLTTRRARARFTLDNRAARSYRRRGHARSAPARRAPRASRAPRSPHAPRRPPA